MEAHHTLICVPLNGIQVKARLLYNLVMTSLTLGRFDLSVFLLILPCWRVFFLGSPALHNAGTDRLQMVGVCSLHVHGAWLLVSSSSRHRQHCSTSKTLEVRYHWDLLCSKLLLQFISESCNKIIEMWIKFVLSNCFILYCGFSATPKEEAGRRRKSKEPSQAIER